METEGQRESQKWERQKLTETRRCRGTGSRTESRTAAQRGAAGDTPFTYQRPKTQPALAAAQPGPHGLRGGAARKCARLYGSRPSLLHMPSVWALRQAPEDSGASEGPSPPQRQLLRPSWAPSGNCGPLSHSRLGLPLLGKGPRSPVLEPAADAHSCATLSLSLASPGPQPLP